VLGWIGDEEIEETDQDDDDENEPNPHLPVEAAILGDFSSELGGDKPAYRRYDVKDRIEEIKKGKHGVDSLGYDWGLRSSSERW
jgi:hypothetical protein